MESRRNWTNTIVHCRAGSVCWRTIVKIICHLKFLLKINSVRHVVHAAHQQFIDVTCYNVWRRDRRIFCAIIRTRGVACLKNPDVFEASQPLITWNGAYIHFTVSIGTRGPWHSRLWLPHRLPMLSLITKADHTSRCRLQMNYWMSTDRDYINLLKRR